MTLGTSEATLIASLLTISAGAVTNLVMQALKKLSAGIDTLSPVAKQALVVILAYGVAKLSALTGVPLAADPTTWTADMVNTILIALGAMGLHSVKKAAE